MSERSLEVAVAKAVASVNAKAVAVGPATGGAKDRIVKIRDRHHQMARLVAANVPREQICRVMGITSRNLDMLAEQTPAFIELIAYYRQRSERTLEIVEYIDVMNANMLAAEQILRDQLMESGDDMSPSVLNKLAMDRADRLGYSKTAVNLNVNVDLATRLEGRRRKRNRESPVVGDGGVSSVTVQRSAPPVLELKAEPVEPQPTVPLPAPVAPAQPPESEDERQARLQAKHPVSRFLKQKYAPLPERIEGYEEVERRI